jgi:HAD superfamily hydrolase (TIGR01549 family)
MPVRGRVIFFDIGHTLVTGADRSPRRLLGARLRLSEKDTKRVGQAIMTHPSTEPEGLATVLEEILPQRDRAETALAVKQVWEEQIQCVKEIEGATLLLRSLKAAGYRLGIISNIWHPFYQGFCEACDQLSPLVDYNLLSYRMGCKKPSPDLFNEAVRRTGESASSCWMVGDSYELDIQPASRAGMKTVWVLTRPEKEKPILAQILRGEIPPPDWATDNLPELYSFFTGTDGGP